MGFTITMLELMAFLRSKGFVIETGCGRHGTKAVKDGQTIPLPVHGGGALGVGVARKILKEAGYSINDVMEWRR